MIFKKFTKKQLQIQQICCEKMREAMLVTSTSRPLDETEKEILVEIDNILTKYHKILK